MTVEKRRLEECRNGVRWKEWGPYLSERQWGTVREDYSKYGSAWESIPHDHARSKAYRWGEDGLGGFSNEDQRICFAWAFWNHKDPILKERLFGLSGIEGNHGEDVKELYYYLDSTPTHSYMKMLYKYPQAEFPYKSLLEKNQKKSKLETEYEVMDTGIFDKDEYFDIFLHYAKADVEDFLFEVEIINRSNKKAPITVLPTFWFRNTWSSGKDKFIPSLEEFDKQHMFLSHHLLDDFHVYFDENIEEQAFTDNETNRSKLYGISNTAKFLKDGINDYIVDGKKEAVNKEKRGSKASGIYTFSIAANSSKKVQVRLSRKKLDNPFGDFDAVMSLRKAECDSFYRSLQYKVADRDLRNIQRQAYAGMMWSKQFYYYNIREWLGGDPGRIPPPQERRHGRNHDWQHMDSADVISMPDTWEYPWYAAWDLAFHCIPIARLDPDFAKNQLLLLLKDEYMHPNGQIPAYEWNFNDVNPPVHAWAVLRVFKMDRKMQGKGDFDFLQKAFNRLLLNFTWWVNRKDADGKNIFQGGFLGLDNIGVFDRNRPLSEGSSLEQADSTSWMAMFALNMLRMSLELAEVYPAYQDMANKFFEHFLYIASAMNSSDDDTVNLWDDEDNFYYDVMHVKGQDPQQMKVRSMVGLIPLFAVETLRLSTYEKLPEFRERLDFFMKQRPKLASLVARWEDPGRGERRLLSLLRGFRMKKILERMLDPNEFLSDYGIRALSKYHKENPYVLEMEGEKFVVEYLPGESDSSFFGGNSNWRGPIWFPLNYLVIESLYKFHFYYGDDFKVEYPIESGEYVTIKDLAGMLAERLMKPFQRDENGNRPVFGNNEKFQKDPHFKDYILFYEYFHGDNGRGLGASHQTGWTGLVADIIHKYYNP
ncbi:glucosidase [Imperialibacter roseus]|uniref:mannosyl-oligosaccharide glucosidase n=1 Tax=Imperialibacter roseus TaxID=1324217 RepID=A0ABZ0IYX8_9BACT|nr:glucosidase [Imperialibacter roseus]WOK09575.1 glucosidase [Imperialibacter roseus]|tara:strand:- start:2937 stop:5564 length:2628 start_codon:yes stop_codon:yes gene_type:complete